MTFFRAKFREWEAAAGPGTPPTIEDPAVTVGFATSPAAAATTTTSGPSWDDALDVWSGSGGGSGGSGNGEEEEDDLELWLLRGGILLFWMAMAVAVTATVVVWRRRRGM